MGNSAPIPSTRPGAPDDFYCGYRPVPPSLRMVLALTVVVLLAAFIATAVVMARHHGDPGGGVWHFGKPREFVGRVTCDPYPMLLIAPQERGEVEALLLVEMGKFGGGQRARPQDGKWARVTGYLLERDGRRMIELLEGDAALTAIARSDVPGADRIEAPPEIHETPDQEMFGEIVDTKCYLGAMKPGDGKAHKECATLCIRGGIPPTFVTRDTLGRRTHYLLTDPEGRALDERILPFVADPVKIIGNVERRGSLLLFKIHVTTIQRV
ncbi:MAG: hypothetical protein IPM64_07335 [Phycisphaerales bacterium]|nr:hypothetical protein [Phycisphaerales bacterium]